MRARVLLLCGCATGGFVPPLAGSPPPFAPPACTPASEPVAQRLDIIADPQAGVHEPLPGLPRFPKMHVKQTYGVPNEFQLNQGKAIDSLRRDYARLFTDEPDFSIFREDIELWDTSGKRLAGMDPYKRVFQMLRFLRSTTMIKSEVTHRLVVTDDVIRIRWAAKLWMRGLNFGAGAEPALMQLDGVSAYELDAKGIIRLHRLENIVLTGPDQPAINLGFAWPSAEVPVPVPARPFFRSLEKAALGTPPLAIATGQAAAAAASTAPRPPAGGPQRPSPAAARRSPPPQASEGAGPTGGETPMERAARERAEDAAKEAARRAQMQPLFDEPKKGPFGFTLGLSAPQACETNFDCERPMICCDLLFASVCCSGGMMVGMGSPDPQAQLQRQAIPIPVERDDDGDGRGRGAGGPQYPGSPW